MFMNSKEATHINRSFKGNKMNKLKSVILKIIFSVVIILVIVSIVCSIVYLCKPQAKVTFNIAEIEDGVYAYRENVISAIPAQNYSMITFSDIQGNIYTIIIIIKWTYIR